MRLPRDPSRYAETLHQIERADEKNWKHTGDVDHPHGLTVRGAFYPALTKVGITASTTQTQGQGVLTATFNQVSTVANTNDTVTLPAVAQLCVIRNDGANTLQIFPASGAAINGLGTNNSTTLAAGAQARFWATSATQWYTW